MVLNVEQRFAERAAMLEGMKKRGLIRGYTITYDSVLDIFLSDIQPLVPVDHINITTMVGDSKCRNKPDSL